MNELIAVKQIPIIEEQLQTVKGQVEARVEQALSLACTEVNVKTLKAMRAELNKEFQTFEERRKEVKEQILTPYDHFKSAYDECIAHAYKSADTQLKVRINEFEETGRAEKRQEVEAYFDEYCAAKGIDFIPFARTGIAVTLSVSIKKLKEQAKDFLDKVSDELALIDTQEHADEILLEYRGSLNVAQAIQIVTARHKAIEEERQRREREQEMARARRESVQRVEEILSPPIASPVTAPVSVTTESSAPEAKKSMTFTVIDTDERLRAIKKFLDDGGYQYE